MTKQTNKLNRRIPILDMNVSGKLIEREINPGSEMWLENTIVGQIYPNLKLVLVNLPPEVEKFDDGGVVKETCRTKVEHEGVKYQMVGSGGGAKSGNFYFADEEHATKLRKRFQDWPEALVSYFGIQTSDCKVVVSTHASVLVVPDNELGTNDCRGWISESKFNLLNQPGHAFYQFRLGFGEGMEEYNGKGSFKIMSDATAASLGVDFVIPESSCKPKAENLKPFTMEDRASRTFTGHTVVGIREVSHDMVFSSSYTVAQHATRKVVLMEFIPKARAAFADLKKAFTEGRHFELVSQIGKKVSIDDFEAKAGIFDESEEAEQTRVIEGILLADGNGQLCRHPYVYKQLDKFLARWAFKVLTGGGLHLPGFALADDGYLFVDEDGQVQSGSDWIPRGMCFTSLASKRSLCVRYPVRMKEDLLPMNNGNREAAIEILMNQQQLTQAQAEYVADNQIFLDGVYTLHSQDAKQNGGDYDFDQVCVVDEARYPMFVQDRFEFVSEAPEEGRGKNKVKRLKSPIWQLETVAIKAMGNNIGKITNGMSSCIAAGLMEKMYMLKDELQKEIDSLKHAIKADMPKVEEILADVDKAPWLNLKSATSVSELIRGMFDDCDDHAAGKVCKCPSGHALKVLPTDNVGLMYNHLREDMIDMLQTALEIKDFDGLFRGNLPTPEMTEEVKFAYAAYNGGMNKCRLSDEHKEKIAGDLRKVYIEAKKAGSPLKNDAFRAWKKAASDCEQTKLINQKKRGNLIAIMAAWGKGKKSDRAAWAQALNSVLCGGKGNGSFVYLTFPQEAVNAIAATTGGTRTVVERNKVKGTVYIKDGVFYRSFRGEDPANWEPLFHFDPKSRNFTKVAA